VAAGRPIRRIARNVLLPALIATALLGCQPAPNISAPGIPTERPAPRHPILPAERAWIPAPGTGPAITPQEVRPSPGPNERLSRSPRLVPRAQPVEPAGQGSTLDEIEALRRELRDGRGREPEQPGPPAGTIDLRPGTIRDRRGTIEVPD